MPDFLKMADTQFRSARADGETARAALFIRPTTKGITRRLGRPNRHGRGATQHGIGFDRNCVLVLSDQRLLAFAHGTLTGRVRELIGTIDLDQITAVALEEGEQTSTRCLTFSFADETTVTVTPGSRAKRFVSAFAEMGSPEVV